MVRCFTLIAAGIFIAIPTHALAWNPPTHTVSGLIAYRTLLQKPEGRAALGAIRPLLYAKSLERSGLWRQLHGVAKADGNEMRFALTTGWADLVRNADPAQHRDRWHYINWPFKPEGEPARIVPKPPQSENIVSALAQNERAFQAAAALDHRAVAFAWLLHLTGDLHQPLHTAQLFTREYPEGDRGGNEICIRVAPEREPLNLHMLWDGWITSTDETRVLDGIAAELLKKFPQPQTAELAGGEPRTLAKESFELAKKSAYLNGHLRGTPKAQRRDCGEVREAKVLPIGYAAKAKDIAERRIALAGYRIATMILRLCQGSFCRKT
jgi:S1/P1 nuclease